MIPSCSPSGSMRLPVVCRCVGTLSGGVGGSRQSLSRPPAASTKQPHQARREGFFATSSVTSSLRTMSSGMDSSPPRSCACGCVVLPPRLFTWSCYSIPEGNNGKTGNQAMFAQSEAPVLHGQEQPLCGGRHRGEIHSTIRRARLAEAGAAASQAKFGREYGSSWLGACLGGLLYSAAS